MIKEFVPYELALLLKELGFNEPCLAYWFNETPPNPEGQCIVCSQKPWNNTKITNSIIREYCWAPLYQQAFRWFREKYELHGMLDSVENQFLVYGGIWDINGYKDCKYHYDSDPYINYEEAQFSCIKYLIEIVKKETKK